MSRVRATGLKARLPLAVLLQFYNLGIGDPIAVLKARLPLAVLLPAADAAEPAGTAS